MLHYQTVNDILKEYLFLLMSADEFQAFRLVGGTALSLQIGHRESVDIDLFCDVEYGTIDFEKINEYLVSHFQYVDHHESVLTGFGKSYFIGRDRNQAIKLDIFYIDPFIQPAFIDDTVRIATVDEIIAMKIDVIQRGGRKKDFWDLHELLNTYGIDKMLALHEQRYPYSHDRDLILKNFSDFSKADEDFDPICLRGKYWQFIKEDIQEEILKYLKG